VPAEPIAMAIQASGFTSLDRELGWRGPAGESGDIIQIDFGLKTGWRLIAEYDGESGPAWVIFEDQVSYRVHDERELAPYWNTRNAEGGPIAFAYELGSSPYLEELKGGVTGVIEGSLRHFLLGGQNLCLEVITTGALPDLRYDRPYPSASA